MRKILECCWFLLISFVGLTAHANHKNSGDIRLTGKIESSDYKMPDSAYVAVWEDYVYGPIGVKKIDLKLTKDGKFDVNMKKCVKFKIYIFSGGHHRALSDYYAEPNDVVDISIKRYLETDSVSFLGSNKDKFELMDMMMKQYSDFMKSKYRLLNSRKLDDTLLTKNIIIDLHDLIAQKVVERTSLLNRYKKFLSPHLKQILNCDYTNYYNVWDSDMMDMYKRSNSVHIKAIIREEFNRYRAEFNYLPEVGMAASRAYIAFFYFRNKFDLCINSNTLSYKMEDLYDRLKNQYPGALKEKLIVFYFLSPDINAYVSNYSQRKYDSLLVDGTKAIQSAKLNYYLSEKLKVAEGSSFYNYNFEDNLGVPVNTSNLKGKVVLIDTWGTGCTGCAHFQRLFEKDVRPFFAGNKDFIVLSINVDKVKSSWLKSMKTNIYSNTNNLNVYTKGLGTKHPFLQYFNVQALPFLLLIDKNGDIAANFTNAIDVESLKRLITENLNE